MNENERLGVQGQAAGQGGNGGKHGDTRGVDWAVRTHVRCPLMCHRLIVSIDSGLLGAPFPTPCKRKTRHERGTWGQSALSDRDEGARLVSG